MCSPHSLDIQNQFRIKSRTPLYGWEESLTSCAVSIFCQLYKFFRLFLFWMLCINILYQDEFLLLVIKYITLNGWLIMIIKAWIKKLIFLSCFFPRGVLHEHLDNSDVALNNYTKAVQFDSSNYLAYFYRAKLYETVSFAQFFIRL